VSTTTSIFLVTHKVELARFQQLAAVQEGPWRARLTAEAVFNTTYEITSTHLEGEVETLYISDKHSEKSTLENRQWSCPTLAFSPGVGGHSAWGLGGTSGRGLRPTFLPASAKSLPFRNINFDS
jgi:hypothetical protein